MSSKTRIVVLHMKEIIYTAVFIGLGVIFIILLLVMFIPNQSESNEDEEENLETSTETIHYIPGTYQSTVALSNQEFQVEVVVGEDKIDSITLTGMDETMETMFPLLEPATKEIESQVLKSQGTDQIEYEENSRRTQEIIVNAVEEALSQAREE